MYVQDVSAGSCLPAAAPTVLRDSPATAWVDGGHGLGPVVGRFCMELAIAKAQGAGVGWVVAKGKVTAYDPCVNRTVRNSKLYLTALCAKRPVTR